MNRRANAAVGNTEVNGNLMAGHGNAESAAGLRNSLKELVSGQPLVLFAGAGVGVRAGLPDWKEFVSGLIAVASKYEPATAGIMQVRAQAGRLDEALTYYKLCSLIPAGEKFEELASPFGDERADPDKLEQLVKLPFRAIVTTNFDRSLHHAWAAVNRKAPRSFELDDGSLKQAAFEGGYYVARIHGRVDRPDSMVLSCEDFSKLDENSNYKDFLLQNILSRQNCFFLGYSFADPAINKILTLLEAQLGPTFPRKHYALLPADSRDLAARLARFNIRVMTYPDHATLWDCVEVLPLELVGSPKHAAEARRYPLPHEQMQVFLASCYVQAKMSHAAASLRNLVLRGIVLSLAEKIDEPKTVASVARLLSNYIPLGEKEAQLFTSRAVDSLVSDGSLAVDEGRIQVRKKSSKALDKEVKSLVRGALSRLLVREGKESKETYEEAVRTVLEEVVFTRGWDLGAEFAGARSTGTTDLYDLLAQSLRKALPTESFEMHGRLANAVYDLLRKPDDREAHILADFARLSFGLNVILGAGSAALRASALPERIYLDASVLMPAITDGHPFRPVYQSTIEKIGTAAAQAGRPCELLVISEFLNEIVSHRKLALRMVRELGLDDPEKLERHILYYGAENTNVFVGAYASWVGQQKDEVSFSDFLAKAAPYGTESSLGAFIESLGIKPVSLPAADAGYSRTCSEFLNPLADAYKEFGIAGWAREKPDVLIEHEAHQLALIQLELQAGRGTYFVTADRALREIVNTIRLGAVWNVVISHLGLVELTDLLLGVDAEPRSLARVMWGVVEVDEHARLRDYFTNLALRTYDDALVMTLPEILNEFVEETENEAKLEGVKLFTRDVHDKAKEARFLDRRETSFFENMAEAISRRKTQGDIP